MGEFAMCEKCSEQLGRRSFLKLAGAAGIAIGIGAGLAPSSARASGATTHVTADEALARLKAGNAKYTTAPQLCEADLAESRRHSAPNQEPWAAILGCADSRVPPELLFGGLNVGEIFVARNAGNMADTATMGTLEYGALALGIPLIVVLGHERCGAVAAACDMVSKKATFPGSIGPMAKAISKTARDMVGKPGDFVDNVVRESARRTAQLIGKSPVVAPLVKSGKVKIVTARYDLTTGTVEFFV
jgi:carbonic anhydrase